MVQRRAAIIVLAVTILLSLIGVRNVDASGITVTPNSVIYLDSFQVSGFGFNAGGTVYLQVWTDTSGVCTGSQFQQQVAVNGGGVFGPVTVSTASVPLLPGSHCITVSGPPFTIGSVTVLPIPTVPTVSVTPNPVIQGDSFQVSGEGFVSGVLGPVEVWADTSGSCAGVALLSQTGIAAVDSTLIPVTFPSGALGAGTHCVFVGIPSTGPPSDSGAYGSFTVIVPATTTTTSVDCSPPTIDAGSTSVCTATVSGASGSIYGETVIWSAALTFESPTTCYLFFNSGTSCVVTVSGSTVETAQIQAMYTGDSNNKVSSGYADLTINPSLLAPSVMATQATIIQGQSTTLTSTAVTTGTPPYTYQWFQKSPSDISFSPILGATSSGYTFSTTGGTQTGTWMFTLKITDSDSSVTSNPVSVTVNPAIPPIPEYPLGISLVAILMIIGYGLIRRRTSTTKNT